MCMSSSWCYASRPLWPASSAGLHRVYGMLLIVEMDSRFDLDISFPMPAGNIPAGKLPAGRPLQIVVQACSSSLSLRTSSILGLLVLAGCCVGTSSATCYISKAWAIASTKNWDMQPHSQIGTVSVLLGTLLLALTCHGSRHSFLHSKIASRLRSRKALVFARQHHPASSAHVHCCPYDFLGPCSRIYR